MKRYIKADWDDFDYDMEEDWFDIYYDEDDDQYVAQGDLEKFQADTLKGLSKKIKEWNASAKIDGQEEFKIVDDIDYSMEGTKDENADYGSFIIERYYATIY